MIAISSTEARNTVQKGLDQRREALISHRQDMEAIGVIDSKHDRERQAHEETQRRIHERFEAEKQRIQKREEEQRVREEERMAARAECRRNLREAIPVSLGLCSLGALHILGVYNPDVALTAGGILVLSGLLYAGLVILNWRHC